MRKYVNGFESVHMGNTAGEKCGKKKITGFCEEKSNALLQKHEKKKITGGAGGCKTEINFVPVGKTESM